jgi:hypothetical protein
MMTRSRRLGKGANASCGAFIRCAYWTQRKGIFTVRMAFAMDMWRLIRDLLGSLDPRMLFANPDRVRIGAALQLGDDADR